MSNQHKAAFCRDLAIGFTCFMILVAVFHLLKFLDATCTTSDAFLNLLAFIFPASFLGADAYFRIEATQAAKHRQSDTGHKR